jgi:hypothetical protein
MKKVLLVALALVLVLLCVSFTACGKKGINIEGPGGEIHISQPSGSAAITLQPGGKTPESFGDIPIYPKSTQLYKITGEEEIDGQPGILDHRMYSTSDSVEKVVSFYKTQMPLNGWTEETWAEGTTLNMGVYNKTEKQSAAVVAVVPGDANGTNTITIDKKYLK